MSNRSLTTPPKINNKGVYLIISSDELKLPGIQSLIATIKESGIALIQLRDKNLPDSKLGKVATKLHRSLEGTGIPLILNDRVELARHCQVDGVHLGQSDMPPEQARELLGNRAIIGLTINTLAQLNHAEALAKSDYYGLGAVFPSPTKADIKGLWSRAALIQARALTKRPIFAIGGITLDNAAQILATGIEGLALSSAITKATQPLAVAQALKQKIVDHSALKEQL